MKYITSTPDVTRGAPVIKGTRIPLEVILYKLEEDNPIEAIHVMDCWINLKVLEGAIDEAIQTITTTFHGNKIS